MPQVTFSKPESYTCGWRGKTTHIEIRLDGKVVGAVIGRENAGMAGVMMWRVVLQGRREEPADSMSAAKVCARALLEGAT
jgi:hypothetical protein